jgi:GTP-binding protein
VYTPHGRGEMQLGVLIEALRREGFELSISPPRVLYQTDEVTGDKLEPVEEVEIEVDEEQCGTIIAQVCDQSRRRGSPL